MMKKLFLILVALVLTFGVVGVAKAIPVPAGPITLHWTNWENRVTGVSQNLSGIFRIDQMLDADNNVVWSHGDGGQELTGKFGALHVYRFDGENPGDRVLFNGGFAEFYLGTVGNFNPVFPGSNPDWLLPKWLDCDWVTGRDITAPAATLAAMITSLGVDPESKPALQGIGRGLLDVVGGDAAGLFNTDTYARYDGSGNVIGWADMSVDSNFFIRNIPGHPILKNPKDGWDVWSKDPLGANAVPEPGTMILFGTGLVGLARFARRRLRK